MSLNKGIMLVIGGADMADNTPVFDIKPYVPLADRIEEATDGFTDPESHPWEKLAVEFPEELLSRIPEGKRTALRGILEEDPRPAYQHDPERVYGLSFAGFNIRFRVKEGLLTVLEAEEGC